MATKISEEEFLKLQAEKQKVFGDSQINIKTPTQETKPGSSNVYDVMAADQAKQEQRTFITPETDSMSRDIVSGTYGFGDAVYDVVLDPTLTALGTASDMATRLLTGFDRMIVDMENKQRASGGSPNLPDMKYGESFAGEALKLTKAYAPKQFVNEFKAQVAAARDEPNAEDRFNMAKKIAGEYASGYVYMFGGLEAAKLVPGLKHVAKKVDPVFRKAILANPFTTMGVELTGVLAETEAAARGASDLAQTGIGIGSTIVAPTPANWIKRSISKNATREFIQGMDYKDFEAAASILQRVADPEVGIQNLNKVMKDGSLPANVRAPLELLLGEEGFTYLETVLNKNLKGGVNIDKRDTEFLQGLNKLLKPVTQGKVTNAEDWFRLSTQLFEKDKAATTASILEKGFKELNKITDNLPDAEQISATVYNSLNESKEAFGKILDDAWDVAPLDKELPGGFSIFQDFKRIAYNAPTIKVDATNINEVLNRFDVEKGFESVIKKLDEDFLIRLNTDDIVENEDKLRQALIEATGGSERVLDKLDYFLRQVKKHRGERFDTNVPTGNAFSNPEAMRRAYGDKYLVDVAQDLSVPFESQTMQTLKSLADEFGIGALPTSAQEVLNGSKKINTIGDLYNLRKRLGVEGMANMKDGQVSQQAFFSNKVRSAILEDLGTLPDEGNLLLKRALTMSRSYQQTFKSGLVGDILRIDKDGSKIDPRQALQGIFKSVGNNMNITGKINTEQILDATKQFSLTDAGNISKLKNGSVEEQLQDYMVNLFVNQPGVVKDGSLVPGRGQQFYQKYKSVLDMPAMTRAKGIILNASGDTSVISKMLDSKTSLAKVYSGYYGKESLGAVNAFLGGDITEGLYKMMMSKGGVQQLKELRKLVRDPAIPDKYFSDLGITRQQVQEGIKDSVRLGLIKLGQDGKSATGYSLVEDLVKSGKNFDTEGKLLPFLREAGFTGADIKNVQKFAGEVSKYNKYLETKGKAGELQINKIDNVFHSVVGLFLGGVGADFFRSGSSLAAASYIKNQTKNTLQRLSGNQAEKLLGDAMADPKLLEALLNTPTHFNKNQIAKRRPYLFKYLTQKGFEALAGPSDEEISKRMNDPRLRAPIDEFLQKQMDQSISLSNISSMFSPSNTPGLNSLNTDSTSNTPQGVNQFIGGSRQ